MDWQPSPRDILIDKVRRGQIAPEEAEQEAERLGFGPLATKPDPGEFNPDALHWWSLPMAVAWIAWRNSASVREHCAEYARQCFYWIPGSWNVPINNGTEFARIDGYELKALGPPNSCRISFVETYLDSVRSLPATTQMKVAEAENQLFAALGAGRLVAVAKNAEGHVVEIPKREWPYLKLFVEGESDVLKHAPLERAAFSEMKFERDLLKQIWEEFLVEPYMVLPMMREGTAGYVPFCSAIHWIMTEAGQRARHLEDSQSWKASLASLLPLLSTGEVQIIGTPQGGGAARLIEGEIFAGILVSEPMRDSFEMMTGEKPWISCTPYVDEEHWIHDFNDQLYLHRSGPASWTHLQVKKADILREFHGRWAATTPLESSDQLPKLQNQILDVAKSLWPTGKTPPRVKERNQAIRAELKNNPPSERTIRRALKGWP